MLRSFELIIPFQYYSISYLKGCIASLHKSLILAVKPGTCKDTCDSTRSLVSMIEFSYQYSPASAHAC